MSEGVGEEGFADADRPHDRDVDVRVEEAERRQLDAMLKTLKHARLDHTCDAELRKLIAVDLLILDDFAIDVLDPIERRDLYDLLLERYRTGSIIVTSSRGPDEWLATFADPVRAQSAIDRFTSNAYDLVIEGESYRPRLKPTLHPRPPHAGAPAGPAQTRGRSAAIKAHRGVVATAAERLSNAPATPINERRGTE
jgi:hypothetical protein